MGTHAHGGIFEAANIAKDDTKTGVGNLDMAATPRPGDNDAAVTKAEVVTVDQAAQAGGDVEEEANNDLEQRILDKVAVVIREAKQGHNARQAAMEDRLDSLEDTLQTITAKLDNLALPATQTAASKTANVVTIDKSQAPPSPSKEGKRFLSEKADIRARIDSKLAALFKKEVDRHAGNASRALDAILWRYFGKPRLSLELGSPERIISDDDN